MCGTSRPGVSDPGCSPKRGGRIDSAHRSSAGPATKRPSRRNRRAATPPAGPTRSAPTAGRWTATRRPARIGRREAPLPDPTHQVRANRLSSSTSTVMAPGSSWSSSSPSSRCGRSRRVVAGLANGVPSDRRAVRPPPPRNRLIWATSLPAGSPSPGSPRVGWSTRPAGTRSATGRDPNGPSTSRTEVSRASTRHRTPARRRPRFEATRPMRHGSLGQCPGMEIRCADCGCVVDRGEIVERCGEPDCCCANLLQRAT
jgi:hypothetical protein